MIFMKDGWQETIWGTLGRLGLVLLVLIVLLLLSALPFNVGYAVDIRPSFVLLAIYYWAVTRPETLNLPAVFFLGLFYDLFAGYPLGVQALTLVLVHWGVSTQRRFLVAQPFRTLWWVAGAIVFLTGLLQWLIFSAFYAAFVPLLPVFAAAAMTAAVFPLAALPLSWVNKVLADRARPV